MTFPTKRESGPWSLWALNGISINPQPTASEVFADYHQSSRCASSSFSASYSVAKVEYGQDDLADEVNHGLGALWVGVAQK